MEKDTSHHLTIGVFIAIVTALSGFFWQNITTINARIDVADSYMSNLNERLARIEENTVWIKRRIELIDVTIGKIQQ